MKKEIFRDIMGVPLKVQYDMQCKRVLGNKIILAWLLKYAVKEFASFTIDKIIACIEGEPEIGSVKVNSAESNISEKITGIAEEDKVAEEGSISYDIRFFAWLPMKGRKIKIIVNVEAQKKFRPGYSLVTRGIYYGARMLSAQQGREFAMPHYDDIKKVYSVWLCMDTPKYIGNAIAEYSIKKQDIISGMPDVPEEYDKLSVVMVCLNDKKRENVDGKSNRLAEMLNVLLSPNISGEAKVASLQNEFGIAMEYDLEKEMRLMCNLSEYVEERGIRKGMERGMERGLAQGRELGSEDKTRVVVRNLLKRGMSDEDICALAECEQSFVDEVRGAMTGGE